MGGARQNGEVASSDLLGSVMNWLRGRLPAANPPAAARPALAEGVGTWTPCAVRVLVVDDNPSNLMKTSALLESRGISPLLVPNGAEAVALACDLHFDLILMDLHMPQLDGWQATLAIREFEAHHQHEAVPILAYSSMEIPAEDLPASGMSGSLSKPLKADELDDCLLRWCPGHRADGGRDPFAGSMRP